MYNELIGKTPLKQKLCEDNGSYNYSINNITKKPRTN